MSDYSPSTFDRWTDAEELNFEDYASDYNEVVDAAVEALTVHLGSEHYFESYAE